MKNLGTGLFWAMGLGAILVAGHFQLASTIESLEAQTTLRERRATESHLRGIGCRHRPG
jgi:hypothetical protein